MDAPSSLCKANVHMTCMIGVGGLVWSEGWLWAAGDEPQWRLSGGRATVACDLGPRAKRPGAGDRGLGDSGVPSSAINHIVRDPPTSHYNATCRSSPPRPPLSNQAAVSHSTGPSAHSRTGPCGPRSSQPPSVSCSPPLPRPSSYPTPSTPSLTHPVSSSSRSPLFRARPSLASVSALSSRQQGARRSSQPTNRFRRRLRQTAKLRANSGQRQRKSVRLATRSTASCPVSRV